MKYRFPIFVYLFFLSITASIPAQDGVLYARVNDDGLRVRSEWNLNAAVLTHLKRTDTVKILERSTETQVIGGMNDYWYRIITDDETEGWVYGFFLDTYLLFDFEHVSFFSDTDLFESATYRSLDGFSDGESGRTWPGHIHIAFEGYSPGSKGVEKAEIYIFQRNADLPTSSPTFVSEGPDRLRDVLETSPLNENAGAAGLMEDLLPVFPPRFMAHQAFFACPEVFSAGDGLGIRFLTEYVQNLIWPPTDIVIYTYQGFTSDESSWISAWFQVRRPQVPSDNRTVQPDDIRHTYETYARELSELPTGEFQPDLIVLDALTQSITVEW